jgi:hypothetical protein
MQQSPHGWGMDGNDLYGCCVFSDCAHQEMLRTANVGNISIPSTADVLALYTAVCGFDSTNPNTDTGADELTVIQYLTANGWLGRKLDASANLDPKHIDQIKWVICLFGACRLGVNLPNSAVDQFNAGKPWDYIPGSPLAGGHDVPVVQYDGAGMFYIVTWGKLQPITQAFMTAHYEDGTPYIEEAHAELAFDWVNAVQKAPSGINLPELERDLTAVIDTSPPPPIPPPVPGPPPPKPPAVRISKKELRFLVGMAMKADEANKYMDEAAMKTDIQNILDAN